MLIKRLAEGKVYNPENLARFIAKRPLVGLSWKGCRRDEFYERNGEPMTKVQAGIRGKAHE